MEEANDGLAEFRCVLFWTRPPGNTKLVPKGTPFGLASHVIRAVRCACVYVRVFWCFANEGAWIAGTLNPAFLHSDFRRLHRLEVDGRALVSIAIGRRSGTWSLLPRRARPGRSCLRPFPFRGLAKGSTSHTVGEDATGGGFIFPGHRKEQTPGIQRGVSVGNSALDFLSLLVPWTPLPWFLILNPHPDHKFSNHSPSATLARVLPDMGQAARGPDHTGTSSCSLTLVQQEFHPQTTEPLQASVFSGLLARFPFRSERNTRACRFGRLGPSEVGTAQALSLQMLSCVFPRFRSTKCIGCG